MPMVLTVSEGKQFIKFGLPEQTGMFKTIFPCDSNFLWQNFTQNN